MSQSIKSLIPELSPKQRRVAEAMLDINAPVTSERLGKVVGETAKKVGATLCHLRNRGMAHAVKLDGGRSFQWTLNTQVQTPQAPLKKMSSYQRVSTSKLPADRGSPNKGAVGEIKREIRELNGQIKDLSKRRDNLMKALGLLQ